MKQEDFIVGKWYKGVGVTGSIIIGWYIKFKEIKNDTVYASEYINSTDYYVESDGNFGSIGTYTFELLEDISEIATILPHNHPDLITTNKNEDDYSYLIPILKRYNIK